MNDKREVVVGVDGSPGSERALAWAYAEAGRRKAPLRVVTAWLWDPADAVPMGVPVSIDLEAVAHEAQQASLRLLNRPEGDPVSVVCEVVRGAPADALVDASARADLVVVGTHGRGPVRQFLMGSVSQSVIRHAHCPVVVMPPEEPGTHEKGPGHVSL